MALGAVGGVKSGEGTRKRLKISVPHFDNSELIKTFAKTVIGRCMNPPAQEMKTLISNLPKIWKLEDRVVGSDLGLGKFQFVFEREEDIDAVLTAQPYHFDYWMLALARWQPRKSLNFPSEIPFWVRILGVPVEFRTVPTFESIGEELGRMVTVDLEHTRVQVVIDAFQELCFETTIDFKGGEFYEGEEVLVSLRYEKLFGYCEDCFSLCHKADKCPLKLKDAQQSPPRNRELKDRNGGWHEENKYDDRARSYKGVILNGNGNQLTRDREARDFYGKGKGRMVDEASTKWMRTSEKGQRKGAYNRGHTHGNGDSSNGRYLRRDGPQAGAPVYRPRPSDSQKALPEETKEEGEITNKGKGSTEQGSHEFQVALKMTQADGSDVVMDPTEMEKGLNGIQELRGDDLMGEAMEEKGNEVSGEVDDDFQQGLLHYGVDLEAVEELPEPTDEEFEEMLVGQEEEEVGGDANVQTLMEEDKGGEKKQGTKKRVPKANTAGSLKLRMAAALASPRKRVGTKPGARYGDNTKAVENKGPSFLKSGSQKI